MKLASIAVCLTAATLSAAEIAIQVSDSPAANRRVIQYHCDAAAAKLNLPSGNFPIEFINAGGNSLAVLPIEGKPLIMAGVVTGSGARYVAQNYTWLDAAGRVYMLLADTPQGQLKSVCQRVSSK